MKGEGISQRTHVSPIDTDNCVEMARWKGEWRLGRGGQGVGNGNICNNVNNKNKEKNNCKPILLYPIRERIHGQQYGDCRGKGVDGGGRGYGG